MKIYESFLGGDDAEEAGRVNTIVMCEWVDVYTRMPKANEVVLIAVKGLEEHGVVSAWWDCEGDEACWVALDDTVNYEFTDVDYWREMITLPVSAECSIVETDKENN